jgi:hypothetical protein
MKPGLKEIAHNGTIKMNNGTIKMKYSKTVQQKICPSDDADLSSILGRFGNKDSEYYSAVQPEAVVEKSHYYDRLDFLRFALIEARKRGLYNGRFGSENYRSKRVQAIQRLKEKGKIDLPGLNVKLNMGICAKDYRKVFCRGVEMPWNSTLELIRNEFSK